MRPHSEPTAQPRQWNITLLLAFLAGSIVVCGLLWSLRPSPESLYQQALQSKELYDKKRLLQQAIRLANDDYPAAEVELCLVSARLKDWSAVESGTAKLSQKKLAPSDLMKVARVCLEAQQWASAKPILDALQETQGQNEDYLRLRCAYFQGTGDHRGLIDATVLLTKAAPHQTNYWLLLAQIHELLEQNAAAIAVYQEALDHELSRLDEIKIRSRLLEQLIHVGDAPGARDQLNALIAAGEAGPRIEIATARLYHLEGQSELALASLEPALQRIGEIPEAIRLRGVLQLELGKFDEAVRDLKRVIELTPHDEIALFKLAESYRRWGKQDPTRDEGALADKYHQRYLQVHQRQLRIKAIQRELAQTPDHPQLLKELEQLKAETR